MLKQSFSFKSRLGATLAVAAFALGGVVASPAPVFAQVQHGYFNATSTTLNRTALEAGAQAANPFDTGGTPVTPIDTSGYQGVMDQMKANLTSVATGPIGLGAIGLMIVGVIFGIAWRLTRKGGKSLG